MKTETEDFLEATMPRLTEAEIALHNGDAGPPVRHVVARRPHRKAQQ